MYKDKEKQREYQREQMRKRRQGITSSTVEKVGITLTLERAQEMEAWPKIEGYNFEVPEKARILLPDTIKRILAVLRSRAMAPLCRDDSEARWERAIQYHMWKLAYHPILIRNWV